MNLAAYDILNSAINKNKTWIDVCNKRLISREIAHRNYVTFGKRFNPEESKTIYFIIVVDDQPTDRPFSKLLFDGYGRAKVNIKSIWYEIGFNNVYYDVNIPIKHIEHTDDGDIYEILA